MDKKTSVVTLTAPTAARWIGVIFVALFFLAMAMFVRVFMLLFMTMIVTTTRPIGIMLMRMPRTHHPLRVTTLTTCAKRHGGGHGQTFLYIVKVAHDLLLPCF
ncbi:MAG: hypothetical protein COA45_05750 [Zetaproteobacteria bacterium]|nr:MAG: hypothetical protein COA45_05750 [Zetaproteobacteria bacterium]